MDQDRIEREIVVRADLEETWSAITQPERVSTWFGTHTEIDLRPGGAALFVWEPHERFHAVVEVVDPPRRFAYRWNLAAGAAGTAVDEGPSTLVEFTLEEAPGGTRIRLVESGFDAIPEGVRRRSENEKGWTEELGDLAKVLGEVS